MPADATVAVSRTGQQTPDDVFGASDPTAVASLLMIAKQVRAIVNLKLGRLDLLAGQEQLLLALTRHVSKPINVLAGDLCVRPSTVSKMVDRLAEKGLVARSPDIDDARKVGVRLTEAGVEMQHGVRAVLDAFETELVRSLADKFDATVVALNTVEQLLDKRLKRLR